MNLYTIFIGTFCSILFVTTVSADIPCSEHSQKFLMDETTASAGNFTNMLNQRGSLKYESQQMLKKALNEIKFPDNFCPVGCELPEQPIVLFRSIPTDFLDDYSDKKHCENLFEKTNIDPITYENLAFENLNSFTSWIGEFSQGNGREGRDLYKKCDESCSPQYAYYIQPESKTQVQVNTQVICGHARDKSSDKYNLSYSYLWQCRDPLTQTESKTGTPLAKPLD